MVRIMDDLSNMISGFLSDQNNVNQLRDILGSLGVSGTDGATQDANVAGQQSVAQTPPLDLSALASILGSPEPAQQQAPPQSPPLDLSALSGLLGGLGGNTSQQKPTAPGLNMNTLLLLQQALSAMGGSDKNTSLLYALKPYFSEERAKKVDDAVRVLQLVRLLPLIKESGLFGFLGGGDKS